MKLRRIQELFTQDRNEGRENDRKYKKKKKKSSRTAFGAQEK